MKSAIFLRIFSHTRSSLNGSEKLRQKFTNFDSCRDKLGELKLCGWTSANPRQAPTPIHPTRTRRPKCPGDAPRLARTGARYSLAPKPYTQSGVFRAFLVVHNPRYSSGVLVIFHARAADALSVFVSCFVQHYRTLEKWVWCILPRLASDLGYLLIFMLFIRLLTRNTSFLFVCHIS